MITATVFMLVTAAAQAPLFEAEHIFPPNDKHNHGSSIVQTKDGDLIACWFHGTGERSSDDVVVQGSRKRAGGKSWEEPFLMTDTQDLPDCNPVLFIDPREKLWLFWIAVQDNQWGGSLLKYRTAESYTQDGPPQWTWQDVIHARPTRLDELFPAAVDRALEKYAVLLQAQPNMQKEIEKAKEASRTRLDQRLGWMTRLHPIMLDDTRMMLGLYSDVFNCSLAAFTSDWGKTWEFSEPIIDTDIGNIQPSFVKKKDGAIAAFMRDNGMPKQIRYSESKDGGKTWNGVTETKIPNPGSSVECISLKDGNWVLVCNDTVKGRHILSAYLSDDEGATWKWTRRIENFPEEKGSASYPSVIQTADGIIHCTYSLTSEEFKGSTINHARFNEEWIKAGNNQ
jgi:predicted neuraminidase